MHNKNRSLPINPIAIEGEVRSGGLSKLEHCAMQFAVALLTKNVVATQAQRVALVQEAILTAETMFDELEKQP